MATARDQICIINDKIVETDRELDDIRTTLQSLKSMRLELSRQVFGDKTALDVIDDYYKRLVKFNHLDKRPRIIVELARVLSPTVIENWCLCVDIKYSEQVEPSQDVKDAYTFMNLRQPTGHIEPEDIDD
uniref:Uncharacterized protein n=1 Tax=viral metagenome TaxID=1070528 RepID=A0A6C0JWR2_9ZZZZ